ncbi:IPT/TIG domain-containing protein [Chitinophaga sp.]|uniref:IPT/TIG domain-containing protein n=1 Tax=Chitinophaga sp. TaxID=1869181 RepID=UPI002F92510F
MPLITCTGLLRERIVENVNNKITVTTNFGTVTFNFQVLQPVPFIYSFDPLGGAGGTAVNIIGNGFLHLTSAKMNDLDAQIVASTDTTIQVTLPAAATPGFFTIFTDGGTSQSTNA